MVDEVDHRTPVHRLFSEGAALLGRLHAASAIERTAAAEAVAFKAARGFHSRRLMNTWMEALERVEAAMTALTHAGIV